jgi:hypothetical protein
MKHAAFFWCLLLVLIAGSMQLKKGVRASSKSGVLTLAWYQKQWHVMFCDFCVLQKARGKLQCAAFISPRRL